MNVVIDYRASQETVDALLKMNINIIKTPKLDNVYDAINGHTDIMIHKLDNKTAVCEPVVYDYFKKKLPEINIIKGCTKLFDKYPGNIAYNTLRVGDRVFCKIDNTDYKIISHYKNKGFTIIDIKQGYAKCSVCPIADNAIITSDKGISKIAKVYDFDTLLIDDSNVKLKGFKNGFFGGATGLIDDKLLVNGDISLHKNHKEIIDFCSKYNISVLSLNNKEIVDIGSIISF